MSEPILTSIEGFLRENKRFLFLSSLVVLGIFLLTSLGSTIGVIVCSYFIALLLSPGVSYLLKWSLPRPLAAVLVMLAVVLLVLIPLAICLPYILSSFTTLPQMALETLNDLKDKLEISVDTSHLSAFFDDFDWQLIAGRLFEVLEGGISASLGILNLLMVPVLVFYFLDEMPAVNAYLLSLFPNDRRESVEGFIEGSLQHFRVFFKGQVLIGVILALLYVIGLTIIQVPTSVSLGIFAGLLNIVPYLGLVLGLLLSALVGINAGLPLIQMLLIPVVFAVVQFLEGFIITPKIMGSSIGISPLLVILSILVFGNLFGVFGVLLAIPVAAVLMTVIDRLNESSQETAV